MSAEQPAEFSAMAPEDNKQTTATAWKALNKPTSSAVRSRRKKVAKTRKKRVVASRKTKKGDLHRQYIRQIPIAVSELVAVRERADATKRLWHKERRRPGSATSRRPRKKIELRVGMVDHRPFMMSRGPGLPDQTHVAQHVDIVPLNYETSFTRQRAVKNNSAEEKESPESKTVKVSWTDHSSSPATKSEQAMPTLEEKVSVLSTGKVVTDDHHHRTLESKATDFSVTVSSNDQSRPNYGVGDFDNATKKPTARPLTAQQKRKLAIAHRRRTQQRPYTAPAKTLSFLSARPPTVESLRDAPQVLAFDSAHQSTSHQYDCNGRRTVKRAQRRRRRESRQEQNSVQDKKSEQMQDSTEDIAAGVVHLKGFSARLDVTDPTVAERVEMCLGLPELQRCHTLVWDGDPCAQDSFTGLLIPKLVARRAALLERSKGESQRRLPKDHDADQRRELNHNSGNAEASEGADDSDDYEYKDDWSTDDDASESGPAVPLSLVSYFYDAVAETTPPAAALNAARTGVIGKKCTILDPQLQLSDTQLLELSHNDLGVNISKVSPQLSKWDRGTVVGEVKANIRTFAVRLQKAGTVVAMDSRGVRVDGTGVAASIAMAKAARAAAEAKAAELGCVTRQTFDESWERVGLLDQIEVRAISAADLQSSKREYGFELCPDTVKHDEVGVTALKATGAHTVVVFGGGATVCREVAHTSSDCTFVVVDVGRPAPQRFRKSRLIGGNHAIPPQTEFSAIPRPDGVAKAVPIYRVQGRLGQREENETVEVSQENETKQSDSSKPLRARRKKAGRNRKRLEANGDSKSKHKKNGGRRKPKRGSAASGDRWQRIARNSYQQRIESIRNNVPASMALSFRPILNSETASNAAKWSKFKRLRFQANAATVIQKNVRRRQARRVFLARLRRLKWIVIIENAAAVIQRWFPPALKRRRRRQDRACHVITRALRVNLARHERRREVQRREQAARNIQTEFRSHTARKRQRAREFAAAKQVQAVMRQFLCQQSYALSRKRIALLQSSIRRWRTRKLIHKWQSYMGKITSATTIAWWFLGVLAGQLHGSAQNKTDNPAVKDKSRQISEFRVAREAAQKEAARQAALEREKKLQKKRELKEQKAAKKRAEKEAKRMQRARRRGQRVLARFYATWKSNKLLSLWKLAATEMLKEATKQREAAQAAEEAAKRDVVAATDTGERSNSDIDSELQEANENNIDAKKNALKGLANRVKDSLEPARDPFEACEYRVVNDEQCSYRHFVRMHGQSPQTDFRWAACPQLRYLDGDRTETGEGEMWTHGEFLSQFGEELGQQLWEAAPIEIYLVSDDEEESDLENDAVVEYRQGSDGPICFDELVENVGSLDEALAVWETMPLLRVMPSNGTPLEEDTWLSLAEFIETCGEERGRALWDEAGDPAVFAESDAVADPVETTDPESAVLETHNSEHAPMQSLTSDIEAKEIDVAETRDLEWKGSSIELDPVSISATPAQFGSHRHLEDTAIDDEFEKMFEDALAVDTTQDDELKRVGSEVAAAVAAAASDSESLEAT